MVGVARFYEEKMSFKWSRILGQEQRHHVKTESKSNVQLRQNQRAHCKRFCFVPGTSWNAEMSIVSLRRRDIELVVVPSYRDLHHLAVYPQPPFSSCKSAKVNEPNLHGLCLSCSTLDNHVVYSLSRFYCRMLVRPFLQIFCYEAPSVHAL